MRTFLFCLLVLIALFGASQATYLRDSAEKPKHKKKGLGIRASSVGDDINCLTYWDCDNDHGCKREKKCFD